MVSTVKAVTLELSLQSMTSLTTGKVHSLKRDENLLKHRSEMGAHARLNESVGRKGQGWGKRDIKAEGNETRKVLATQ